VEVEGVGFLHKAEEEVVVVVCMLEGFPFLLEHMLLWLEVEAKSVFRRNT